MGLHGRTVDQKFGRRPTALRQRLEQARPDAFRSPALKPIVERLARAIRGRRILPPRAGQHDLNDATDHTSIIHTRLATRIGRQMWRNPRKLSVRKPEKVSVHRSSPFRDSESQAAHNGNPFMGSGP